MDNPQDCLVTSSQDVIEINCPSTSGNSATIYQNKNGRKKKLKSGNEQFPWFISFQKLCRSVLGSTSMKELLNIITVYTEHVSRDVVASYSKPNRAAKLRTNMISMLGFFHNCYITMKEPFDEAAYLEKMSNLLTMYFDMEVKASRRGKESVKRITSKLISALFIILNNSAEYILDTILKARFTVKCYSEICIPIFKMVTHLPQSQEMNYVRCLLVFKLWKRMLPYREERNSINRLAVAKLSPPPAQVLEFIKRGLLASVLPTPPLDKKPPPTLITRFYMTKKFNLRESIKAFLKMEAELKLNDFTSALDCIRFDDEENEDVVPPEDNFKKDYSLLESIWIDISKSPVSPDPSSLTSPSTSDSSPIGSDAAYKDSSGADNCVVEPKKRKPSKVNRSLFKPKSPKKAKQQKKKNKGKSKKNKVDFIIDLCREYEENHLEHNPKAVSNLNQVSDNPGESQVCEESSPSSTYEGEQAGKKETKVSISSESIPAVNCSKDLKSCRSKIENEHEKISEENESKTEVKNQLKSEVSSVPKAFSDGVSKPQTRNVLRPLSTVISDPSASNLLEAVSGPEHVPPVDSSKNVIPDCKSKDKNHVKLKLDQESKGDCEAESGDVEKIKEVEIPQCDKEDVKPKSDTEENLISEYEENTANFETMETETPVNKIVISCKNFSKIGFTDEVTDKKVLSENKLLNEESGELVSSIEISEDPILKTEMFKEDSLFFNDGEESTENTMVDQIVRNLDAEDGNWDKNLKPDLPQKDLTTNENSVTNNSNEDFGLIRFTLRTDLNQSNNSSISNTLLQKENISSNKKVTNKQASKPVQSVFSKILLNPNDSLTNNLEGQHQNHANDAPNQLSMIHKFRKEESSSTSSDNSNQESSEISSSSFEDCNKIKSNNKPNHSVAPLVESHDSKTCKVEKIHFKELSACMQNPVTLLESGKFQLKEKFDKNIQVPSEQCSYVIGKSSSIARSQCSNSEKHSKQVFSLQNNTCLLHKILEEDCIKSGCLLRNSSSEKLPRGINESQFPDVNLPLKQELENSSDLPCGSSTSTIPSLWNPIAGIKLEKELENSRNSECMEGIRNTSSEFLVRSVTEACNFKELDYTIGNECDNLNQSYDSDCEDRNLIIDEDIDSIKDPNETEDIQLKYGIDYIPKEPGDTTVNIMLETNNNKKGKEVDKTLLDKIIPCEAPNIVLNHLEQQSVSNKIKKSENTTLQKSPSGKHKLPRIIESNIKTSSLRNSYANEVCLDSGARYRPMTNSEVLFTENNAFISTQHHRGENSNINTDVHIKQSASPQTIARSVGNGQTSPSCRVYSPYSAPPVNDSSGMRGVSRDPRLRSVNANINSYQMKSNVNVKSTVNIQSHQIQSLESINAVNKHCLSAEISQATSPRLVPSPGHYEAYSQYNVSGKISVPSNQSSSGVERYCQRSPLANEKYVSLENMHRNRDSPTCKLQESSVNASQTNVSTYADGNKLKDSSNSTFHKYNANEPQQIKVGEVIYGDTNLVRDPLCLVKNKEDVRETYDFEFNVLPIAQEIEICSGSENIGGEWLYQISSEIGHPDWPIANEQNVIDSSVSYPHQPEQYMYSAMIKSDQACTIAESEQPSYIPLELHKIDNRQPNIAGKNINKEKLNLHKRTLEGDTKLWRSQDEFKKFNLSRDIPPTIPVPFPPQGRTDNLNSVRCPCDQCSDNHQKLLSNYNLLTHFRNSKIKPICVFPSHSDESSFTEKDQNGEFDSSLPLKKRKTLTNSKTAEELVLPSYPNTPMISIAQLELTGYEQSNQVIVPNPQSQWRDPMVYNALNLVQPPSIEPFDGQTRGKRKATKRRKSSR